MSDFKPEPAILDLVGELDMHHVPAVRAQLDPLVKAKAPRVLIGLGGVTYIDSSGLALFIETLQQVQGYGGQLALFGLRAPVRHIFEIARLDQIFELFPDKSAALGSVEGSVES